MADVFLGQPANTVTSFAFVLAGLLIVAGTRYRAGHRVRQRLPYGVLVAAIGAGSVIQHGPHPSWQAYAHDLPLAAVLAYVAVDAARDLLDRPLPAGWWLVPTAAFVPLVAIGPGASSAAQVLLAVVAIGLGLARAVARPPVRRTLLIALTVLGVGAAIGTLAERTAWEPGIPLPGHAVWHVLAALALWLLTPAIGRTTR